MSQYHLKYCYIIKMNYAINRIENKKASGEELRESQDRIALIAAHGMHTCLGQAAHVHSIPLPQCFLSVRVENTLSCYVSTILKNDN